MKKIQSSLLFIFLLKILLNFNFGMAEDIEKAGTVLHEDIQVGSGLTEEKLKWPKGEIYIYFDKQFSWEELKILDAGLRAIESKTCIRFFSYDWSNGVNDYINVTKGVVGGGSTSAIGRQGGQQSMTLDPFQISTPNFIHLLIHAIGFYHEHQRPDRDDFVLVYESNILSGEMRNFEKQSSSKVSTYNLPYDFNSIMHYGSNDGAKHPKRVTLESKVSGIQISRYPATQMSYYDGLRINRMYRLCIAANEMTKLWEASNEVMDTMASAPSDESVYLRVWMLNSSSNENGCGLFHVASDSEGEVARDWFPPGQRVNCDDGLYYFRVTRSSTSYLSKYRVGKKNMVAVQMHADGWCNTYLETLCFGFNLNTIEKDVAGKGFCLNQNLLKKCKKLTPANFPFDLPSNDILFTRTSRGMHKLLVNKVAVVISAFEKLTQTPDDSMALSNLCGNVRMEKGPDDPNDHTCFSYKNDCDDEGRNCRWNQINKNPLECL